MKIFPHLFLTVLLAVSARAEFRTWTRGDGKTAELDLRSVTGTGDAKSGTFMMRNGQSVTIKASTFSEADVKLIEAWEPPPPVIRGKTSVFDKVLDGNLVKVDGKEFKTFTPVSRPDKYYVFYYTASWCGPCQKYTPSLVDFYNKHKNSNFELVLITADRTEEAMLQYAVQKKMPWPLLDLKDANSFRKEFNHGVSGIPSVIVCDLTGKILGNFRDLAALEKLVK